MNTTITKTWTIWTNIPDTKPINTQGDVFYRRLPLKSDFPSEDAAFQWLIENAPQLRTDRIYEISLTIVKQEKQA